jgi:mercuric ion transport protein
MTTSPLSLPPMRRVRQASLMNYLSLFGSFSTLVCCALPSLLVLFGMGAAVVSMLTVAPWLVTMSRHKIWTFSIVRLADQPEFHHDLLGRTSVQGRRNLY